VKGAVALYDKKIAGVIWRKLKEEEKKKFVGLSEGAAPGFTENGALFRYAFISPVQYAFILLYYHSIELIYEHIKTQMLNLPFMISSHVDFKYTFVFS
jgi:hypothetical protein